jgi:hypothetical protein
MKTSKRHLKMLEGSVNAKFTDYSAVCDLKSLIYNGTDVMNIISVCVHLWMRFRRQCTFLYPVIIHDVTAI